MGSNVLNHKHFTCVHIASPDLDLLRSHSLTRHIFTSHHVDTIDRTALDDLLRLTTQLQLDSEHTTSLFTLSDRLRLVPRTPTRSYISLEDDLVVDADKCCMPTLFCEMVSPVIRSFFLDQINTKTTPRLCHLFSKCLNTRCKSRVFCTVALRYIEQSQTVKRQMEMLLCASLLGNYSNPRLENRPTGQSRLNIFQILYDEPKRFEDFFMEINTHCELLMLNSMREFMLSTLDDTPWLKKHISERLRYETFSDIVFQSMNEVRAYFSAFISIESSALYAWLYLKNEDASTRVLIDLNVIMKPSHHRFLKILHRQEDPTPFNLISTAKRLHPLKPIPGETTDDSPANYVSFLDYDETGEPIPHKKKKKTKNTKQQKQTPSMIRYLNPDHYTALQAIVQRCNPTTPTALVKCVKAFWVFGVSRKTIQWIVDILVVIHKGGRTTKEVSAWMGSIQKYEPYTFTLLQVTYNILKQLNRHYWWFQLPFHYIANQCRAIQNEFDVTRKHKIILKNSTELVFCEICGAMYSLVRVFGNKETGKKMYKQYYRRGLRDAVVSYDTGETYCKGNTVNMKGSCGAKPLTRVCLLGRALWMNSKCYMICPQPTCGLTMEFDPHLNRFNSYGVMCSDCTENDKRLPATVGRFSVMYTKPQSERTCFKCSVHLQSTSSVYLLPAPDLYLCKKHCSPWLVRAIEEKYKGKDVNSKEELQQFILQKIEENKNQYKTLREDGYKRKLSNWKRDQSNKRVRR